MSDDRDGTTGRGEHMLSAALDAYCNGISKLEDAQLASLDVQKAQVQIVDLITAVQGKVDEILEANCQQVESATPNDAVPVPKLSSESKQLKILTEQYFLQRKIIKHQAWLHSIEISDRLKERGWMIEQLRELRKLADDARLDARISDAVRDRTSRLESDIASLRSDLEKSKAENAELRASKRRLREALERVKGGKK